MIPGLLAVEKAVALGSAGAAGGYAVKKGLKAAEAAVRRRRRQRGHGLLAVLGKAVAAGYQLGKDKRYKRMGATGVTGHY